MKIINMKVTDTKVRIANKPEIITSGNLNYIQFNFDLDEVFDGLIVRATFNGVFRNVENGVCIAPLLKKGEVKIGVYGYTIQDGEYVLIVSPAPTKLIVRNGSFDEKDVEADIATPTELEAHYLLIKELVESGKIKGDDGFSPVAKVERNQSNTGVDITITDKEGTTSATVYDGQGGGGATYTAGLNIEIDENNVISAYRKVVIV